MKKIYFLLTTLLFSTLLLAQQKETFDNATYTPPKGWTKDLKKNVVTYTKTDSKKNAYCVIAVYASTVSAADAKTNFNNDWDELVVKALGAKDAPKLNTANTNDGKELVVGMATYSSNGSGGIATLCTYTGSGKVNSVLAVLNDTAYQATVLNFISNISFKKQNNVSGNQRNNNTGSGNNSHLNKINGAAYFNIKNGIEGVWMGLYLKEYYGDPLSLGHSIWKTFYGNGQVYEAIPDKGFANFDKSASESNEPQFWNRYVNNGQQRWIIKRPGVVDIDVKVNDRGNMETGSQSYQRCKPVDGLKLNGTWTSVSNPDDPEIDNYPAGKKPLITFYKNGQFIDEGIFNTALEYHNDGNPIKTAGAGTYKIINYSVILQYSDGHIKQAALTGFMSVDPAVDDKSIFISRVRFQKRRR